MVHDNSNWHQKFKKYFHVKTTGENAYSRFKYFYLKKQQLNKLEKSIQILEAQALKTELLAYAEKNKLDIACCSYLIARTIKYIEKLTLASNIPPKLTAYYAALQQSAKSENPVAMYDLVTEFPTLYSDKEKQEWLKKSHELGYGEASFSLFKRYFEGSIQDGPNSTCAKHEILFRQYITQAANRGVHTAYYTLGTIYERSIEGTMYFPVGEDEWNQLLDEMEIKKAIELANDDLEKLTELTNTLIQNDNLYFALGVYRAGENLLRFKHVREIYETNNLTKTVENQLKTHKQKSNETKREHAIFWYTKAAKKGHTSAERELKRLKSS